MRSEHAFNQTSTGWELKLRKKWNQEAISVPCKTLNVGLKAYRSRIQRSRLCQRAPSCYSPPNHPHCPKVCRVRLLPCPMSDWGRRWPHRARGTSLTLAVKDLAPSYRGVSSVHSPSSLWPVSLLLGHYTLQNRKKNHLATKLATGRARRLTAMAPCHSFPPLDLHRRPSQFSQYSSLRLLGVWPRGL
jgi:hypothetical protein